MLNSWAWAKNRHKKISTLAKSLYTSDPTEFLLDDGER